MIKILSAVGQVALAAQPAAATTQSITNHKQYKLSDSVPSDLFTGVYKFSKEGFVKLLSEANDVFSDFNVSKAEAEAFYAQNPVESKQFIKDAMRQFGLRGFWSKVGNFFKGVGQLTLSGLHVVGAGGSISRGDGAGAGELLAGSGDLLVDAVDTFKNL